MNRIIMSAAVALGLVVCAAAMVECLSIIFGILAGVLQ